ncbi:hypothetical protein DL96DRAFT_1555749 [Flagelloscypha sp. PMI_526]|nr:hypothetical protein DL96DRAFT_1555749 [Flagelloscypha sp. PMI_526]
MFARPRNGSVSSKPATQIAPEKQLKPTDSGEFLILLIQSLRRHTNVYRTKTEPIDQRLALLPLEFLLQLAKYPPNPPLSQQAAIEVLLSPEKSRTQQGTMTKEGKLTLPDFDHLKFELTHARKSLSETTDRLEKQKKHSESLETRLREIKRTSLTEQAELKELKTRLRSLEHEKAQLQTKQGESGDPRKKLGEVREKDRKIVDLEKALTIEHRRNEVLELKLQTIQDDHEGTLSKPKYQLLQEEAIHLRLQHTRLQRKHANVEMQVKELAYYLRHLQEENSLLRRDVRDLEGMIGVAETCSLLLPPPESHPSALIQILDADEHERISSSLNSALCNEIVIAQSYEALYSLLFPALVEAEAEAQMANTVGQQYLTAWREMHNERDSLVEEREALRTQTEEMRLDKCGLESRLNQTQDDHRTIQRKAADDLRKEQETVQLLNSRTHFHTLKDQVDSLSARNDLAQGEAEKLSKLNAQILGHGNPAQRIMYVDKIRQELSQCKQDLLQAKKVIDSQKSTNSALQNEVDMYSSISVPLDKRVSTKMTRLVRGGLTAPPTSRAVFAPLDNVVPPTAVQPLAQKSLAPPSFNPPVPLIASTPLSCGTR